MADPHSQRKWCEHTAVGRACDERRKKGQRRGRFGWGKRDDKCGVGPSADRRVA